MNIETFNERYPDRFRCLKYRPTANKGQEWLAQARGVSVDKQKQKDVRAYGSTYLEAVKALSEALTLPNTSTQE